jgi:hypothetical protein
MSVSIVGNDGWLRCAAVGRNGVFRRLAGSLS